MDTSIYEKSHERRDSFDDGVAIGKITRVFPSKRLCEVKTFIGKGNLCDLHLPNVQWLSMDAHPDGDESTVIPRVGSHGLVFLIGGQPFIFGFFVPTDKTGKGNTGDDRENLQEGDRVFKTLAGNKIILHSHGEIEIQASTVCKRIMLPDSGTFNDLCRNYEFRCDGGTVDWINQDKILNTTLHKQEFRSDVYRSGIVVEERGNVGGLILKKTTISNTLGPVTMTCHTHEIDRTGKERTFISVWPSPVGYEQTRDALGNTKTTIMGLTTIETSMTGAVSISVNKGLCTLEISPTGALTVTTKTKVSVDALMGADIKATGPVKIASNATMAIEATGPCSVKGAIVNVEAQAQATVKAPSVVVDAKLTQLGGPGAVFGVHSFPNAISDFTGMPVMMGSTSVMVTK